MKENSIEEAIERIAKLITTKFNNDYSIDNVDKEAIETVLNLLEKKDRTIQQLKDENRTLNRQAQQYFEQGIKKDKIIDLMAKELVKAHEWFYSEFDNYTKEDFIKYFERKVEEEK